MYYIHPLWFNRSKRTEQSMTIILTRGKGAFEWKT